MVNEKLTHKIAPMKLEKLEKGSEETLVPHGKDVALNYPLRASFILLHSLNWVLFSFFQFKFVIDCNYSMEVTVANL